MNGTESDFSSPRQGHSINNHQKKLSAACDPFPK